MRYFLLQIGGGPPPAVGQRVLLTAEESHHALKVMRSSPGTRLHLVDGEGRRYEGALGACRRQQAEVEILSVSVDILEPRCPLLGLAVAVVKGPRFDWVLEKAVELGAHWICPLVTQRAVIRPGSGRQQRWEGILRAALKQSGRSLLPRLHPPQGILECLTLNAGGQFFYGERWPDAAETTAASVHAAALLAGHRAPRAPSTPPVLVWLVGPEGGWTAAERQQLAAAQAHPVSLGPHRLRTETAALAGLSLLQILRQSFWDAQGASLDPMAGDG